MGARAESLAKQYEAKAAEMTATINKLSDADWTKTTAAEKWPVGVTAHHVAGAHEPIAGIAKTVASGQSIPNFTAAMLDELNAKHARTSPAAPRRRPSRCTRRAWPRPPRSCAASRTPSWTRAAP